MEKNLIQKIFREINMKYRMYNSRKEIKTAIIITIFIYYMIENKEKYKIEISPILAREVISSLIKAGKTDYIELEIIRPIEKQLNIKQYISDTFANLKVKKDPIILYEIFENVAIINNIEVEELIKFINLETEAFEIKEARSINQLIKKIAPKKYIKNVFDGFAGIGETIFESIEDKQIEIELQDIDEGQCAIATILLVMQGYKNFTIKNENTLTYYDEKTFDLILTIPPLMLDTTQMNEKNYINSIYEYNKRDSWGSVLALFNKIGRNGQLITLVSAGALTSGKKSDITIREFLTQRNYIKAIIELPAGMLYGTGAKTSLVMIDKSGSAEITLINLDCSEGEKYQKVEELGNLEITSEGIEEIYEIIYKNKISKISRNINKNELLENKELLPSLYTYQEKQYKYENINMLLKEKQQILVKIEEKENKTLEIIEKIRGGGFYG